MIGKACGALHAVGSCLSGSNLSFVHGRAGALLAYEYADKEEPGSARLKQRLASVQEARGNVDEAVRQAAPHVCTALHCRSHHACLAVLAWE